MAGIDRDLSRPDPLVAVFVRRDLRTFSWRLCPASSWPCTCLACSPPACSPQASTYSCVTGVPAGSARRGSTVVVDNRRRELLRPRGRAEALAVLAALLMLALWPVRRRAILPQGRCQPNEAPPSRAATVDAPSGARLAVRHYGSGNGPVLVLTHGWGADQREWTWLHRSMPSDTRMVTWDLPGLSASTPPRGKEYSLPQLAGDLDAVVGTVKDAPVVPCRRSRGACTSPRLSDTCGTVSAAI
jgi:hypothetical protein